MKYLIQKRNNVALEMTNENWSMVSADQRVNYWVFDDASSRDAEQLRLQPGYDLRLKADKGQLMDLIVVETESLIAYATKVAFTAMKDKNDSLLTRALNWLNNGTDYNRKLVLVTLNKVNQIPAKDERAELDLYKYIQENSKNFWNDLGKMYELESNFEPAHIIDAKKTMVAAVNKAALATDGNPI